MLSDQKDLIVLVADRHMEQTFEGLLERDQALDIRPIEFDIQVHPQRDPGCTSNSSQFLRPFFRSHRFAIVVFDLDGSGSRQSRTQTQTSVQMELERNGWQGNCKVIAIDPELEAWIWTASPHVSRILGWPGRFRELREFLENNDIWPQGNLKPPDPKQAMDFAIEHAQPNFRPRKSAALFNEISSSAGFGSCNDPAFEELLATLRNWFPREWEPAKTA